MISTKLASIGLAASLAAILPAVSAQALAPRTFVSAAGTDNSTCSFAAPCRHFQAAVDATSDGGEVDALDPAGYSPITISRGVTIEGQGWSYIAPPANGAAITINAVSGKVTIRGVSLNGVGVSQAIGIEFNSGASLNVQNSVIENFSRYGILYQPNASSNLSVSNTVVSDNNYGIYIGPLGTGTANGVLDHVHTDNNTNDGITVTTVNSFVQIVIRDSVISDNGGTGVVVTTSSPSEQAVHVTVRSSTIANNGNFGLVVGGGSGGSTLTVSRSTIAGNANGGWNATTNALLNSYSDNINDTGNVHPTQNITYE
jgi:hypothetical protein